MANNKFEMKIRQDDDSFVCEITNGSISICVSNDGEEEDMQAIVDALNKPNVKWYSNNKLELDQHIEIMQLQEEWIQWKAKYDELKAELDELKQCKKGAFKLIEKQTQDYAALQQQHEQLKERVKKMISGLKAISQLEDPKADDARIAFNYARDIANTSLCLWKEGEQKEYNRSKEGKEGKV